MTARHSLDQIVRGLDGVTPDHERIWLQNSNDAHGCEGRLWCQDKVWPEDDEQGEPTEYVRADLFRALEAERDSARNDEWLAAITAIQYMEANWHQDCRSEVERKALEAVAEDFVRALKQAGPTEYLDMKWKDAEAAMAAEARATAAEATVTALQEALEPFANSDMAPDTYDDDSFVAGSCDFTCGDVRRARAALSQIRSEK